MTISPVGASSYCEITPPVWLRRDVLCSWVGVVGPEGPPPRDRVLPDGCVDVIWDGKWLFVAGPDKTAERLDREAGSVMVGVRLKPGRTPALTRVSAAELTGMRIDLAELWGRDATELAERLDATASPNAARRLLVARVVARLADGNAPDEVTTAFVGAIASDPRVEVNRLANEIGISRRQLQRRSLTALGYGPKTFARIMRFQRFVGLGRAEADAQLARLARAAGYADQAHLTRECRRLSGLTPRELLDWQRHVPFVQDVTGVPVLSSPV
jgi:AraC-like DNA-binding protein